MNKQPNIDPGESANHYLLRVLPRLVKRAYYLQPLENRVMTSALLAKTREITDRFIEDSPTAFLRLYYSNLTPVGRNNLIGRIAKLTLDMSFSEAGLKYEVRGHHWIDIDPIGGAK